MEGGPPPLTGNKSDSNSWNIPGVPLLAATVLQHPQRRQEGLQRALLALGVRRRPVLDRMGQARPREGPRETVRVAGGDLRSLAEKSLRLPNPTFPTSFLCLLLFFLLSSLESQFCLQASHPAGRGLPAILKLSPVSSS